MSAGTLRESLGPRAATARRASVGVESSRRGDGTSAASARRNTRRMMRGAVGARDAFEWIIILHGATRRGADDAARRGRNRLQNRFTRLLHFTCSTISWRAFR